MYILPHYIIYIYIYTYTFRHTNVIYIYVCLYTNTYRSMHTHICVKQIEKTVDSTGMKYLVVLLLANLSQAR